MAFLIEDLFLKTRKLILKLEKMSTQDFNFNFKSDRNPFDIGWFSFFANQTKWQISKDFAVGKLKFSQ